MPDKIFRGDRLKKLRTDAGMTQQELADRLNIAQTQIYQYESQRTDPSPDVIVRIAREFGATSDYLLGLVDKPTQRLQEEDLTSAERKLLSAFRSGDMKAAMKALLQEG